MNKSELKNRLRGKIGLKDVCTLDSDEERQLVWDLIEKDDKYAWHDLRKDPTDLPTRDVLCLTIDEFDNLNLGCLSSYSVCNIWTGYGYLSIRQPIAWKEIEPFEVEEDE